MAKPINPGDFNALGKRVAKRLDRMLRGTVDEMAKRVVSRTPAGSGMARGSWYATVGKPNGTAAGKADKQGSATLSRIRRTVAKAKAGNTVYLMNNADNIRTLENGVPGQAGHGMVRRTVAEAGTIVRNVARKQVS